MPEVATISAAISSVKNAYDIVKAIKQADVSLDRAETKLQITQLLEALIDAREQTIAVREELQEKDAKIAELEERLKVKDSLGFKDNSYWIQKESGEEGPFCTVCWDREDKLSRMHHQSGTSHWYCVTHGSRVITSGRVIR